MTKITEYVVGEFIKLVSVCNENGMADLIGDLPALPYCFPKRECFQVGSVEVCWSDWLRIRDFSVRIECSTVEGVTKAISFHVRGIKCDEVSGEIYHIVRDYIINKCSINKESSQL
ncbi:MAG: hypothetical protein QN229_00740 [Desulfurococcaceae archaeon TW002]